MLATVQILLRVTSVAFNAAVTRKIGAEATGLFTLVMSVYGLSVTLASSGVHLAAVRLTARALAQSDDPTAPSPRAVVRGCILYSLLLSSVTATGLYLLSSTIGEFLLCDVRTIPSLRALALSLPAISLSSALSGYFTGLRRVYKNVIVSVVEQFLKITLTAALLLLFVPAGIEYACLAVVGGSAAAEAFSAVSALLFYLFERKQPVRGTTKCAFSAVFGTAFPIAISACARQGLVTAEHIAIPWGLKKSGANATDALASYGVLHGMVYPLIFFPSAVLSAFSSLLVPEFAECHERGDRARICRMADTVLHLALLFSIGIAGLFISFSYELGEGIYPGTGAAAHIAAFAPLIPVMYLDSSVDAMLKGLGEQLHCMKINLIDASLCLILVLILLPRLGLRGYYIVQYVCELLNATLSISQLLSVTGLRPRVRTLVGIPLVCVIFATSIVRLLAGIPGIPLIGMGGSGAARIFLAALLYFTLATLITKKRARATA